MDNEHILGKKIGSPISYVFLHLAMVFVAIIPFSSALSKLSDIFLYCDELVVICLLAFIIFGQPLKKASSYEKIFIALFCMFVVLGLIGNLVSGTQSHAIAVVLGVFGCLKFTATFFIILYYYPMSRACTIEKRLLHWMQLVLIVTILFYIANIGLRFDETGFMYARFGIPALSFFGHPSNISSVFCALTSYFYYKNIQKKCNVIWVFMSMSVCVLSLRAKAFAILLVFLYALVFFRKKIGIGSFAILIAIIIVVIWPSIEYYYLRENASRAVLLRTSFEIANDSFPIGSGFNTFGTMLSGRYYSGIYYQYGLSNRWGFSPDAYSFLTDGGYATIIAEFGWLGTIVFVGMLVAFLYAVAKRLKFRGNKIPVLLLIVYMLLAQTNEQSLSSNYAPLYAALLAIEINGYISEGKRQENCMTIKTIA